MPLHGARTVSKQRETKLLITVRGRMVSEAPQVLFLYLETVPLSYRGPAATIPQGFLISCLSFHGKSESRTIYHSPSH